MGTYFSNFSITTYKTIIAIPLAYKRFVCANIFCFRQSTLILLQSCCFFSLQLSLHNLNTIFCSTKITKFYKFSYDVRELSVHARGTIQSHERLEESSASGSCL